MEENKIVKTNQTEELDLNEIIKIQHLPEIFEQLEKVGKFVDEKLKGVTDLKATDTNKSNLKDKRTEINNTLSILEDKRKEIKKAIEAPYDVFNEKYTKEVKDKLEEASKTLTGKINFIEDTQKKAKEKLLRKFFEEYKISKNIDFVTFEQMHLNIILSITEVKYKNDIVKFLDKVSDELDLINLQSSKEEIMYEYKKTLDLANSIKIVQERKMTIERAAEENAKRELLAKQQQENVTEVKRVLTPPVKEVKEEIYQLTFTVRGTKNQLVLLKNFLNDGGYEYE
jgi:hypothetical protein